MIRNTLFAPLLASTYEASGTTEPIERFYACLFDSYFSKIESQPSCATVHAILQGKTKVPRKLLRHYRDPNCPRYPEKLAQDLSALAECCFLGASRRNALRNALEDYMDLLPQADRNDLLAFVASDDLIRLWTVLTWYALCGDHSG